MTHTCVTTKQTTEQQTHTPHTNIDLLVYWSICI